MNNFKTVSLPFSIHVTSNFQIFNFVELTKRFCLKINNSDTNQDIRLHKAAKDGKLNIIHSLLHDGIFIDLEITIGENIKLTPVYFGLFAPNYLEVIHLFIAYGANINHKTKDDASLLHFAVRLRNLDIIKILVENGININAKMKDGTNALHIAAECGKLEIVNFLIEKGIDIYAAKYDGMTALHTAINSGNLKVIRFLIDKGIDINAKESTGLTPLHLTILTRDHWQYTKITELVKFLLDKGANVNAAVYKFLWTALHFTSSLDVNDTIAPILIKYGADLNMRDYKSRTTLHLAVETGNFKLMNLLVQNGADINAKMELNMTPIHLALFYQNNVDEVKFFISNGAYYDAKSTTTCLPIEIAEESHNLELYLFLKLTDKMFKAVKKNNLTVVENCVKEGAIVNSRSVHLQTPLIYASWKGYVNLVNFLLENGAEVNFSDEKNSTALHYAVKYNHLDIVISLLKHGAIFDFISKNNKKPIDFTSENTDIAYLLKLIQESFEKIKNGNCKIINELKTIKAESRDTFLSIMKARNNQRKTLVQSALLHNHVDIAKLLINILTE